MARNNHLHDDDDDWGPEPTEARNPIRRDKGCYERFLQSLKTNLPDYAIVALAIGEWASRTPVSPGPKNVQWALEACVALYEQSQEALGPVVGRHKRRRNKREEETLAAVADVLIDSDAKVAAGFRSGQRVSARAAIYRLLALPSSDLDNTEAYKLQILWGRDRRHQLRRANLRLAAKFRAKGWLK